MLQLPDIFQWGPFNIPVNIAILAISAVIAGVALLYKYRTTFPMNIWHETLTSGIVVFILVWKLSYILTGFQSFIKNPISILYGNGGLIGFVIGISAGAIAVYKGLKKGEMAGKEWLDLTAVWLLLMLLLYSLAVPSYGLATDLPWGVKEEQLELLYHPLHLYRLMAVVIVLVLLIGRKYVIGNGNVASVVAVSLGLGLFLISLFDHHPFVYFGLSREQWVIGALTIAGIIGMSQKGRERKNAA